MNKKNRVINYRQEFPILTRKLDDKTLIYFDNAATVQKPSSVIAVLKSHYEYNHANVHRASHTLSAEATLAFENARNKVKCFINASTDKEIIWTKGATESINLVAQTWGRSHLSKGDEIILSYSEHHANIVPWQMLAESVGINIKVAPLTDAGLIDTFALESLITSQTKLIALTHISNVVGKINDISAIIGLAKKNKIITLIDGSQAVPHINVDVQALDCDFYVFSAHKMYGPNGVGVLYGKESLLDNMPPYQGGGEMIQKVSFDKTTYAELPFKFEPGTPNISGVIAFSQAIDFMDKYASYTESQESELTHYTYQKLSEIPELTYLFTEQPDIPLFSFILNASHHFDLSSYLNGQGIAIRSGHHCAMPLMEYKQVSGCIRVSLAPYNTFNEVDTFVQVLKNFIKSTHKEGTKNNVLSQTVSIEPPIVHNNKSLAQHDMEIHFSNAKSWDSRHRLIMLLGKELSRLPSEQKNHKQLIEGCESSAWLTHEIVLNEAGEQNLIFKGDSDAKVIRGLLAIVFAAVNNQSANHIIQVNMSEYFEHLGLLEHLSPSRGNGLNAIVKKVQAIAHSYL